MKPGYVHPTKQDFESKLAPAPAPVVVTDFGSMADAAWLSAAGQALVRRVQSRIMGALKSAGFVAWTWTPAPKRPKHPAQRTVREVLKVGDPLTGTTFDYEVELRGDLRHAAGFTRLHLVARVRSTVEGALAQSDIAYKSWSGVELALLPTLLQEAFEKFQQPDAIADDVFDSFAANLSCALAP